MARSTRSTNGSVAPVCPVSRSQTPPGMPANIFAYVPKPSDLPSAIAAANQLAAILQPLAGLGAARNNVFPPFMPVPANINSGPIGGVLKKTQRWSETERQTATIRFYPKDSNGNEDKEQWIEVKRIVHIVWHDKVQKLDLTVDWPYDHQVEGGRLMKMEPPPPKDSYYAQIIRNPGDS
jgi:hypothetical protein